MFRSIVALLLLAAATTTVAHTEGKELVIVTVATHATDGFHRFNRSINLYGLKLEILGLNEEWKGGDISRKPGGGQKINFFRKYLENVKDDDQLVVLFTDSYDVIFTDGQREILKRFATFDANVVFSSEKYCWPDTSLANDYPKSDGKRFLNSGGFVGYAADLYKVVTYKQVEDTDDDQLYYTKIYLNEDLRKKYNIKLDLESFLFQNLNGHIGDVEIRFTQGQVIDETNADAFLFNKIYQTKPLIIHGNGLSKVALNSLGNYLAKSWHPATGCLSCHESQTNLDTLDPDHYPYVLISINVLKPTPFFEEFLEDIVNLNYPKNRLSILIQTLVDYHSEQVESWMNYYKEYYYSIQYISHVDSPEWKLRNEYLDECVRLGCEYLFVVDSEARIINPETLRSLITANKSVIAPVLVRPKEYWSNFWGSLTDDGFYARSHDYIQIVKNDRRGIWNVPHISLAYLIKATLLDGENKVYNYKPLSFKDEKNPNDDSVDSDMYFCQLLRDNGVFLFVTNLEDFGHLARMDTYEIGRKNPDLYDIYANEIEWRRRYIHENYSKTLLDDSKIEQPCPDVYWFPVVSPRFCHDLIEIMENFGQWSPGKNYDPRLAGAYENVPTRDIHMNQVGFEQHWLYFLREYIRPMQEKIFTGYFHDPPKAIMNFVVRYHPDEQNHLRPHHDASTYTINIALNRPNIDFEGGGCRFVRYNCSVLNMRVGWSLIHPGRLTHYHEGLTVTKGVRYIMVSFVDP